MRDLVLDSCCALNLLAAGKILQAPPPKRATRRKITLPGSTPPALPHSLDFKLHVPLKVKQEVRYIRKPEEAGGKNLVQAEIDLAPLFQSGALHDCDLEGDA